MRIRDEAEGIFTQHSSREKVQFDLDRGFYCINYCGLSFNRKQAASWAIALEKRRGAQVPIVWNEPQKPATGF